MVGYLASRCVVWGATTQDRQHQRDGRGASGHGLIVMDGARPDLPRRLRRLAIGGHWVARHSSTRQRAYRDGSPDRRAGVLIVLDRWPS